MAITLAHNGGAPLSLASYGIDRPRRVVRSMEPDEFSFDIPRQDVLAADAFAYGDTVQVYDDAGGTNVCIFNGTIRKRKATGTPNAERDEFIAYNLMWDLDHYIYLQYRLTINDAINALTVTQGANIVLGQGMTYSGSPPVGTSSAISLSVQIGQILSFAEANAYGAFNMQHSVDFSGYFFPYEDANGITCAAAIRRVCSWFPDIFTWVDYTTTPPTLHVDKVANATPLTVNLTSGNAGTLKEFFLEDMSDLVPKGISFTYQTTLMGATGKTYAFYLGDSAGTTTGLQVIRQNLPMVTSQNLGQQGSTAHYLTGFAAIYLASLQTMKYKGQMQTKARDCTHTYRPGNILNFSNGRTEWTTAKAVVQAVSEDLFFGETTISMSPPPMLSVEQFFQLAQRLQNVMKLNGSMPSSGMDTARITGEVPITSLLAGPTLPPMAMGTPIQTPLISPDVVAKAIIASAQSTTNPVFNAITGGGGSGAMFGNYNITLCDGTNLTVLLGSAP